MIIRVFNAKVRPGRQNDFKQIMELLSIPQIQARNGMIAFYPGQPTGPESNEFILVTVWRDQQTLKKMSEEEWASLVIPDEARPILEDVRVHRYQAFGVEEQALKPLFQNI